MKKLIVGITGQALSGKDSVANYLVTLGFLHVSTSELIRVEMRKFGMPVDRENTGAYANKCRQERGGDYLAVSAIQMIQTSDTNSAVVSGLRNVTEVQALRKAFGADLIMLVIEAPIDVRYKRALGRNRIGDDVSFEQFKKTEEAERIGSSDSQQIDAVVALADMKIINDGTLEQLLKKVDDFVLEMRK